MPNIIANALIHFYRWNAWRKNSLNNGYHKFMVLIGLRKSPTMTFIWPDKALCLYKRLHKNTVPDPMLEYYKMQEDLKDRSNDDLKEVINGEHVDRL